MSIVQKEQFYFTYSLIVLGLQWRVNQSMLAVATPLIHFIYILFRFSKFQELFVPINTKGELYEVCPEELSPAEWDMTPPTTPPPSEAGGAAHRLPHLLSLWPLPARVRLLAGTVPIEMAHDVGGRISYHLKQLPCQMSSPGFRDFRSLESLWPKPQL